VSRHAECEELAWSLQQFRPQLLMVLTRARAAQALEVNDHAIAIQQIEEGLEKIRAFCHEHARGEAAETGGEVQSLEAWLEEIRAKRPLSRREKLEQALHEAINSEDYERAAKVRDELRNLKPAE
jgi:excinuclease UvrABC helicase subunit UvrB